MENSIRSAAGRWAMVLVVIIVAAALLDLGDGRTHRTALAAEAVAPQVVAADQATAGRYLIEVGGCNDCHTPGFMEGKAVPENQWLTGVPVGFRGPWGTTYASNLRLWVQPFTADQFIEVVRARNSRPPMPWASLHAMSDADLRAMHAYLKKLGPAGDPAPEFVPPGQEPTTPYFNFVPQMPSGSGR